MRKDDISQLTETHGSESLIQSAEEILRRRAVSLGQEADSERTEDTIGVLLFRLGHEWYGVRVGDVREIYQEYRITSIPCVPDFILGVVNIRGEIISVTDVAKVMRLGQVSAEFEVPPAIVIQNAECVTAIVVDEIGDIADVPVDGVEPPVSTMDKAQAEFISGSVYVADHLIGLVSVDRILQPIEGGA
ncbi:MAG: chemotaxis protein CheW [Coriobacteriia bacterium]|nr:chemotaxis protein CheW [Coriobacteriia bacterium]